MIFILFKILTFIDVYKRQGKGRLLIYALSLLCTKDDISSLHNEINCSTQCSRNIYSSTAYSLQNGYIFYSFTRAIKIKMYIDLIYSTDPGLNIVC